jgi:hypothetical protein
VKKKNRNNHVSPIEFTKQCIVVQSILGEISSVYMSQGMHLINQQE